MAKEYIKKVKALKTIPGTVTEGIVYSVSELKEKFGYLDLKNRVFFEEVFDTLFKVNDEVAFIGKIPNYGDNKRLSHSLTYTVIKVIPQLYCNALEVYYVISEKESKKTYEVKENDLQKLEYKYIISFGESRFCQHPAVHKITTYAYKKNIKDTWKSMFAFDTFEEALNVAKMFEKCKDVGSQLDFKKIFSTIL